MPEKRRDAKNAFVECDEEQEAAAARLLRERPSKQSDFESRMMLFGVYPPSHLNMLACLPLQPLPIDRIFA